MAAGVAGGGRRDARARRLRRADPRGHRGWWARARADATRRRSPPSTTGPPTSTSPSAGARTSRSAEPRWRRSAASTSRSPSAPATRRSGRSATARPAAGSATSPPQDWNIGVLDPTRRCARSPVRSTTAAARRARQDVRKGVAPSLVAELRLVAACAAHTLLRACLNGVTLTAHALGRAREALASGPPGATL